MSHPRTVDVAIALTAPAAAKMLQRKTEELAELWNADFLPEHEAQEIVRLLNGGELPEEWLQLWQDYADSVAEWHATPGPALVAYAAIDEAYAALTGAGAP